VILFVRITFDRTRLAQNLKTRVSKTLMEQIELHSNKVPRDKIDRIFPKNKDMRFRYNVMQTSMSTCLEILIGL
jgi:hypothetical protein